MTPGELRRLVDKALIYKMSLGKGAEFRSEAKLKNVLVFGSEKKFYEAVVGGDEAMIARIGNLIKTDQYPSAGAEFRTYSHWRRSIESFGALADHTLIVHWEADVGSLYWGLTEGTFTLDREITDKFGQRSFVFHRRLVDGWHKASIGGVPLSDLHPKARDIAVNQGTLNLVQTHSDYLRSLILDQDTLTWENRPDWRIKAKEKGWHSKPKAAILSRRSDPATLPFVLEVADDFLDDVNRMASTAIQTVAYANGQQKMIVVKVKTTTFTKPQLVEEIAALLKQQNNCCALTGYKFNIKGSNLHLRPSLDRRDSNLGYIAGNLQIVTRAANFFKSASDELDWAQKADAMERMAIAIQQRRKANESV